MKRIILVGFMGSGKSTLGKKVANRLGIPFIDSDAEIEKKHQKSIGEIFGEQGESRFRILESEFIDSLSSLDEFVLSTGGGMPCFENNSQTLKELGVTFYLERSPKELMQRLRSAKIQRPLIAGLSDTDLLRFIEDKLNEREEYYKQATFTLPRNEQTAEMIEKIMSLLHPPQVPQKS